MQEIDYNWSADRPINKAKLAQLILKFMYVKTEEEKETFGIDSMLSGGLAHFFKITKIDNRNRDVFALTAEEKDSAQEILERLQYEGLIRNDPNYSSQNFKKLTTLGKQQAEKSVDEIKTSSIPVKKVLSGNLYDLIKDSFGNQKFDDCIQSACKLLEVKVREKAEQPPEMVGVKLMSAAFGQAGVLRYPSLLTKDEEESLATMFRGCYGLFRNPNSHRYLKYSESEAVWVLGIVDYLLKITSECVKR